MADSWQQYQDEAAEFFRTLGLEANTNHTIQGVRTIHAIDVFVKSHHAGFDVVWIVECKHWKNKVSKLHVLALREIVADVGADRGILLSEAGFQSGAVEAATLTSVHVTSLANLRGAARADIRAMRMREAFDRVQACKERYWKLSKGRRIDCGLRPDAGEAGYSGTLVIGLANEILLKAFRNSYPVYIDDMHALALLGSPRQFATSEDVLLLVEPMISELEEKLAACEASLFDAKDNAPADG